MKKINPNDAQRVDAYCEGIITALDKKPVDSEKRQVLQETITPYDYRQQLIKHLKLFAKDLRAITTRLSNENDINVIEYHFFIS